MVDRSAMPEAINDPAGRYFELAAAFVPGQRADAPIRPREPGSTPGGASDIVALT
jgi:hypothetical protein